MDGAAEPAEDADFQTPDLSPSPAVEKSVSLVAGPGRHTPLRAPTSPLAALPWLDEASQAAKGGLRNGGAQGDPLDACGRDL